MKKFLYSVWNDIKKNKFFNSLLLIEMTVLIFVLSFMLGATDADKSSIRLYDKNNSEISLVSFSERNNEFLKDYIGKEGFENVAFASFGDYIEKEGSYTCYVNVRATQLFKVPHSGDWFSGEEKQEYKEALAPKNQKSKYKKGQIYKFDDGSKQEISIKIIGYLGSEQDVIQIGYTNFVSTFGWADFMICDTSKIDMDSMVGCIATDEKPAQFYEDTYDLDAVNFGESFKEYRANAFPPDYMIFCVLSLIFAITLACIICNSVFKVEHDIKRNMLKFIVGNSNRNIVWGEIIKSAAIFIVPFTINFVLTTFANIAIKATPQPDDPIIFWEWFYKASAIVLGIYIASTIFGLIRTIKAKPLDEIRRE